MIHYIRTMIDMVYIYYYYYLFISLKLLIVVFHETQSILCFCRKGLIPSSTMFKKETPQCKTGSIYNFQGIQKANEASYRVERTILMLWIVLFLDPLYQNNNLYYLHTYCLFYLFIHFHKTVDCCLLWDTEHALLMSLRINPPATQ